MNHRLRRELRNILHVNTKRRFRFYMPRYSVIINSTRRAFLVDTSLHFSICVLLAALLFLSSAMADENVKAVIAGNNQLTGKLYAQLAKPKENIVFSPLSLHTVLSLVYQGSKGETENALKSVLNVPDKAKTAQGFQTVMEQLNSVENVTLEIANKVYVKSGYNLKASFKEVATKQFAAGAENLEFTDPTAASTINGWVESKTNNKIKDLIKSADLDELTRLVLVNAIYFKGDWADKFNKDNTKPDKFYVSETETVPCDMMFRSGKYNYKDDDALNAQVIELPYKNKALSMIIVLPKTKTGIAELEQKLSTYDLTTLNQGMYNVEVELSLPRFKIESEIPLNEPLEKMGLKVAFSNDADFSELLDSPEPLKISKVIQKAFIEVNEEGAEAAAATGVVAIRKTAIVRRKEAFKADHPFVFALLMKTNQVVLFQGRLNKLAEIV